jgi:hypothetical protein
MAFPMQVTQNATIHEIALHGGAFSRHVEHGSPLSRSLVRFDFRFLMHGNAFHPNLAAVDTYYFSVRQTGTHDNQINNQE